MLVLPAPWAPLITTTRDARDDEAEVGCTGAGTEVGATAGGAAALLVRGRCLNDNRNDRTLLIPFFVFVTDSAAAADVGDRGLDLWV